MKHTVKEVKLRGGLKGLFIDIPDASVMTMEFNVRAGEYLVSRKKWEVPHLMEHLLLGANDRFPKAREFQAEFEKNGAYNNASTGPYDITYEAECADFEWDRALELMLVAISKPLFLADEFEAEFGNVREELIGRANNYFRHLNLALREAQGFTAVTDQERVELMENVHMADVSKHYHSTHTMGNTRFIIAGRLRGRHAKIKAIINQHLTLPRGGTRIALPDEAPKGLNKTLILPNQSVKNVYFYIDTYAKGQLENSERDALLLASTILTETLYSRILGTARERGLVYAMGSGFGQAKLTAGWWLGAQVSRRNSSTLFDLITSELCSVLDGNVTQADIIAGRQHLLGKHQRAGQTVGGTAAGYAWRYYMEDAVDDYYLVPERLKAVTKQAVVETMQRMFSDKVWGLGLLGSVDFELADDLHKRLQPLFDRGV